VRTNSPENLLINRIKIIMADIQLQTPSTAKNVWKAVKPYVLGGVSGMFATVRFDSFYLNLHHFYGVLYADARNEQRATNAC